ncbi:transposase [Lapidilactobacillus bayanensis]|uniref:transposase n=1 Tax=Lapidilactobacillus bayanensis TaxID=2485998 RepID=UPI0013DE597C|nr:transposase [Lapidilactobacillus bayanensis]
MNQKYTNDFKETILSLLGSGVSASKLAKDYDVSVQTIYKWSKQNQNDPAKQYSPEEIHALKQRALQAEKEVEILKKALAIFGRNNK